MRPLEHLIEWAGMATIEGWKFTESYKMASWFPHLARRCPRGPVCALSMRIGAPSARRTLAHLNRGPRRGGFNFHLFIVIVRAR